MKHTVLIVEDERELRELMCEALEGEGYTVVAASDGQEALDAIARIDRLCLILLDLVMPGMNGWDFFAAVKQRPELGAVPIIVNSSATERAPTGVTRVVRKPWRLDRLLMTVREYCAA